MNVAEQFEKNWKDNFSKFGSKPWNDKPDFVFFVETPLPVSLWTEMERLTEKLKSKSPNAKGLWFPPQRMHITLALPARQGMHFQANGIKFMKDAIGKVVKNFSPFPVILGNVNCFPDVLFREVFDEKGALQALHNAICRAIPFSQDPSYQFEKFLPHVSLFLGKGDPKLFEEKGFSRELKPKKIEVERIFLGHAKNDKGEYERRILEEFQLK